MRLARATLRWMLIGLLVMFVLGLALSIERRQALAGGFSEMIRAAADVVLFVGLIAASLAIACSIALYLAGVWRLGRAADDDVEFSLAAARLRIATVAAVFVTGTLCVVPASPSLGSLWFALAALATASLAVHVWALARVRFICMRRIGAWGSGVGLWSNAVLAWSVAGGLCMFLMGGGQVVSPLAVLVFLSAVVVELGLFTPIETHVTGLINSRGAAPLLAGARHVPSSTRD